MRGSLIRINYLDILKVLVLLLYIYLFICMKRRMIKAKEKTDKEGERIFHLLGYSPNTYNSQG